MGAKYVFNPLTGNLDTTDVVAFNGEVNLGTAAAPSVFFTGDTNTGIYSPGPDQVAISTNGTQALYIDSDGDILVADGNRMEIDEIRARDNAGLKLFDDGGAGIFIEDGGNVGLGTSSPATTLDVNGNVTITDKIIHGGDTNTAIRFPAADTFAVETAGTERLRVDSSGNVGIGTTSPGVALHVDGDIRCDGVYGETDTDTSIQFPGSDVITFNEGGSEAARIDSSGRLLVGTSSARSDFFNITNWEPQVQLEGTSDRTSSISLTCNKNNALSSVVLFAKTRGSAVGADGLVSSGDTLGYIGFMGNDGAENVLGAEIKAQVDGTPGADDMPGRLVFSTTADGASSPTERMRIDKAGTLYIGQSTTSSPGNGDTTTGFGVTKGGRLWASTAVDHGFNRNGDGIIISLRENGTEEGNISVSGNTVSYNQFLGSHWAALTDWSRPEIKIGTILETINELTDWKYAVIEVEGEQKKICYNGTAEIGSTVTVEYEGEEYEGVVELETDPEFNKAVKVKVNDSAASKRVYGVFVSWNTDKNADGGIWNDMYVGAVGNYVIRMAAGQDPEIGDLVEADGTGCAVVQDDDIIRTKTVAKITSTIPQVTYDDGSFLVTCVLYCG